MIVCVTQMVGVQMIELVWMWYFMSTCLASMITKHWTTQGGEKVLFPWFQGLVLYPSDCTSWQQQDLSRQYVLGMCNFLH